LRNVDTPGDGIETRWAALFSERYDQIAREAPEFARLRELAKAMAIAKWLKKESVPVDMEWVVREVNGACVQTVDRVEALSFRWKSQQRMPPTNGSPRGGLAMTELHLFGRVDLMVTPRWSNDDRATRRLGEALTARLRRDPSTPVFGIRHEGTALRAIVLPVTASGQEVWRGASMDRGCASP